MKTILFILLSLNIFPAATPTGAGYKVGDTVEDFTLKNTDGSPVSLSEYGEKGAIVIFDCNTCPYSIAYRDRIIGLHEMYAGKGYPVMAINSNDPQRSPGDSFEEMVNHASQYHYKHEYLYDADQEVAKTFGATNTPHVFIIKKDDNKMTVEYIGAIDNNIRDAEAADKKYVEDAIDAILDGKAPATSKTKAIGCTIKWAS